MGVYIVIYIGRYLSMYVEPHLNASSNVHLSEVLSLYDSKLKYHEARKFYIKKLLSFAIEMLECIFNCLLVWQ